MFDGETFSPDRIDTESTSRRGFLKKVGVTVGSGGLLVGGTGTGSAEDGIPITGTIQSYDGRPVPWASVMLNVYGDGLGRVERQTFADRSGSFEIMVPEESRAMFVGLFKTAGSYRHLISPRLNEVPHVYSIGRVEINEDGYDFGVYKLPKAHLLDVRAVLAEQKGVEDARVQPRSETQYYWLAPGMTTNEEGYMSLEYTDFTGLEMAGDVEVMAKPPKNDPRFDQEEHIRNITVTEDTSVEIDISRRATRGKR